MKQERWRRVSLYGAIRESKSTFDLFRHYHQLATAHTRRVFVVVTKQPFNRGVNTIPALEIVV